VGTNVLEQLGEEREGEKKRAMSGVSRRVPPQAATESFLATSVQRLNICC